MIVIKDKAECCGCSACKQICPRQCIAMRKDAEGFLYPEVEVANCIECGMCEEVCPVIHPHEARIPTAVYAAINRDERAREASSSGGIFPLLAEGILAEGGVVFGAAFNADKNVVHGYAEEPEGVAAFRGSKYVQSDIGDSFLKAESFLKAGRKVLFTGTPCQVAGLKRFLRKEYANLLAVDIACHGVPSPTIWQSYLTEFIEKNNIQVDGEDCPSTGKGRQCVRSISFRDKSKGWNRYSLAISLSSGKGGVDEEVRYIKEDTFTNPYLRGFGRDLFLRPSCYHCPAKKLRSESDLTIGDYWGVERIFPTLSDDKGISFLFVHGTTFDPAAWSSNMEVWESTYADVLKQNPFIEQSAAMTPKRAQFFERVGAGERVNDVLDRLTNQRSIKEEIKRVIKMIRTKK